MADVKDPLPSWHEGKVKQRILTFIEQVTDPQSPYYVEPQDRIATFDNDGTLWVEKPILTQLAFYKKQLLNADVINSDSTLVRALNWLKYGFLHFFDILRLAKAYISSGLTTDEYRDKVAQWISVAKHPRYQRKYTELTYQPMMELMELLSDNGFSNYIVSGGTTNLCLGQGEESDEATNYN